MPNRTRALTALFLAAAGLGACSDSSGPSTTPLSASNAAEVGAAAASTADLAVRALMPSVPDFSLGFPMLFDRGRTFGAAPGITLADSMPNCPMVSSLTDSDQDGVPDNTTWTFDAFNCTKTDIEGNRSVVTGSVVVRDPGLTAGYNLSLSQLTGAYYQNGAATPLLELAMNGTWALRGTSDALSLDQNYNFALTVQNEEVQLTNDLGVTFLAANGTAIAWGSPLPDGSLAIQGEWQVDARQESHHLVLYTLQPLVYDDTCGGITGGALQASGEGGAVTVTWTACGIHTSAFVPN